MANLNEQYPMLFACNLPVKGAERALLCDIQRQVYQVIPLSLYDVLVENENKTLADIKAAYENEHDEIIDEYFEDLVKEEWAFFTDTPQYFPKMDLYWEQPTSLTNAIIDIFETTNLDFENLFQQFSELGCEHVQIRCFADKSLVYFQDILNTIGTKRIISIEFVIKFQKDWLDKNFLIPFCEENPRVASLCIYNAPENRTIQISSERMGLIFFSKSMISDKTHCGQISNDAFIVNAKTFTEAQKHNTCLNRKISIDTEGYIRNCPSMKEHLDRKSVV